MLFVKDVHGNLVNLTGKDIVIRSIDDWDMFGEYSHTVRAVHSGVHAEVAYPTEFVLWHGTLEECQGYLEFLADHLALGSDLRLVHQPRNLGQTMRPREDSDLLPVCEDREEFPF